MKTQRSRQETIASRKKVMVIVAVALLVCLAAAATIHIIGQNAADAASGRSTPSDAEGVIIVDGQKYIPENNLETYLFIGVDSSGTVHKKEGNDGTGQSDVLMLLVRNVSTGTFQTLTLDRNTMADVDSLDDEGNYIATTRIQLAFAHANGDGLESSCENTVKAVSNYLGGQKIDGYAAVNISAISLVNDMVGGVEVTIEDDFSGIDASLKQGETIVLQGDQAEHFVRSRMGMDDASNTARMRRQSVYMAGMKTKLREKCAADNTFPVDLYNALEDYMVTNISAQKFSKLAMLVVKDKDEGEVTIEGTSSTGRFGYTEFEPDEDSLNAAILQLFYKKYE
ncbi:MAG: LCP family protein [Wujia sp.]